MSTDLILTKPFEDLEARILNALNQVTSGVGDPETWLVEALGGGVKSSSGTTVTTYTALGSATVWSSVNLIAGHMASMPIELRKREGVGSTVQRNTPANRVLNVHCNELQTPFTMKQTVMLHALLEGNGRMWINRNSLGQPIELVIMQPSNTFTVMVDGAKWHCVWFGNEEIGVDGSIGPQQYATNSNNVGPQGTGVLYKIDDADVLHIPGLGYNGLWGYELIRVARDQFGLESAGTGAMSYALRNGGKPGLILTAPQGMFRTEKEASEFMAQFRGAHEGFDKTGRVGLLREGMTASSLNASNFDKGFTELRNLTEDQIALLFGTEYLLGNKSAVYKDLPDRMSAYVMNTLNKWMETWEQECRRKLLPPTQQQADSHFFSCDASQLMRGSPNNMADYTMKLRQQAVISQNDARIMHGLNPVPGLDSYDNPNVAANNVQSKEMDDKKDKPEDKPPQPTASRNEKATLYAFKQLMQYEKRRVIDASKGNGNFLTRLESFYDSFGRMMNDACTELEIDAKLASDHCQASCDQLLEISGLVNQTGLTEAVENLVKDWETRAERFANV